MMPSEAIQMTQLGAAGLVDHVRVVVVPILLGRDEPTQAHPPADEEVRPSGCLGNSFSSVVDAK
jgi:hypothetical protein